ncbi:hypothetical protein CH63R_09793 [Colletotrichum higginsianum IMI 349063]|uniref:Uncharacterized protein n=1 Tax=Colletotrichum higginsianum (strain IMI 349063) TaxID=759273 RepID=A0A1B7Y0Z4_COLHI|nr:uncharacterized protein CH63R_09793 [Colletotrichum higginsianum IMI 349063]OBR05673.1 hypothetical protein CH63R_09793 [Colletotrichum higginsianum IMI 349063]
MGVGTLGPLAPWAGNAPPMTILSTFWSRGGTEDGDPVDQNVTTNRWPLKFPEFTTCTDGLPPPVLLSSTPARLYRNLDKSAHTRDPDSEPPCANAAAAGLCLVAAMLITRTVVGVFDDDAVQYIFSHAQQLSLEGDVVHSSDDLSGGFV